MTVGTGSIAMSKSVTKTQISSFSELESKIQSMHEGDLLNGNKITFSMAGIHYFNFVYNFKNGSLYSFGGVGEYVSAGYVQILRNINIDILNHNIILYLYDPVNHAVSSETITDTFTLNKVYTIEFN